MNFSGKLVFLNFFFMNNFFERHSYPWGDRRPMIEKKNYISEKTFLPWYLFPSKKLIVLVWFNKGGTQKCCYTQILNFRIIFLKKKFFSKDIFEWHSYKWGHGRPMIEGKTYVSEKFFHRKPFFRKKFWLVWYKLSKGLHTHDDGIKKYI